MTRHACLLTLVVLLGVGCSLADPLRKRSSEGVAANPSLAGLDRAALLYAQGDFIAASIEYRTLADCSKDPWQREEGRIGTAKSLLKLHRYPAALTALGTLPANPVSETDARKLAVAGEIYLRQRRTLEAESCLELALDACPLEAALTRAGGPAAPHAGNGAGEVTPVSYQAPAGTAWAGEIPEAIPPGMPIQQPPGITDAMGMPVAPGPAPPWMAGCCANLGYAYLKNDKPEKAAVLYEYASHLYREQGEWVSAERALRVADDLNAVLRQYAPFKPAPLTQRLPPGRK